MTNFEIRKQKANILMEDLISILDQRQIPYFISGYEYLLSKNNAMDKIKKMYDKTSEFVRFYPDITMVINQNTFLAEVKNSSGIEKNCFMNYVSLQNNLNVNVVLFLKNKMFCNLQDLVLAKSNGFDSISKMHIPVTNDIWREPRLMPKNEYYQYLDAYKKAGKLTSGSSFAFIDFINTKFYDVDTLMKSI